MPLPGGPGSQRAATRARVGAYKKRQRNLARIPKARPYTPPMPATERAPTPRPRVRPAPRPTPKQVESAKAQERYYASQGRAVKNVAAEQRTGLTRAQRRRLTRTPLQRARATGRSYASQGRAIEHEAAVQQIQSYEFKKSPKGGYEKTTPNERRARIKEIKSKAPEDQTLGEYNILRIHGQRQGVDVRQRKDYGFLPRTKITPTYEVRPTNVMPKPSKEDKQLEGASTTLRKAVEKHPQLKAKVAGISGGKPQEELLAAGYKDLQETSIGLPTSIAHLASTAGTGAYKSAKTGSPKPALKAGKQIGKEFIEPYKELYKHPRKFAGEHPLTTALMVAPVAPAKFARFGGLPGIKPAIPKVADVAAGKVARVVSKKALPLKRPDATLPGTSLRELRVGSPRWSTRREQAKQDVKEPAPTISVKGRGRRVDEFVDRAQQQKQAMQHAAVRDTRKKLKGPQGREHAREVLAQRHDAELADLLDEKVERPREVSDQHVDELKQRQADERAAFDRRGGKLSRAERRDVQEARAVAAGGGARNYNDRQFAHEVGSDWRIDPTTKTLYKSPKGGSPEGSGQIHATREDAQKVADAIKGDQKVDWTPKVMEIRGDTPGETGGYAVVPSDMAARYTRHRRVGRGGFAVGPGLRVAGRQFRRTVLPMSTKWLVGQAVEGGIRGVAAGVTPASKRRWTRVLREVEGQETEAALKRGMSRDEAARHAKGAVRELEQRVTGGGLYGGSGFFGDIGGKRTPSLARQLSDPGDPAPEWLEKVGRVGQKPGFRHIRKGYDQYTNFVFNEVNGRIEQAVKRGLAGKAIAQGPLMDRRLKTLSDAAVREAAEGLRNTSNMVQLAREVDRAYGKYSKYSPKMRDTLLHTSPFLPWFLNMGKFLTTVMPKDHPVMTSLAASMNEGDREWRMKHRLSFYGKHVPGYMMGSYPKGDKYVNYARFMPFVPGEWAGALGGQVYPQISGTVQSLSPGVTWKGQEIEGEERKAGAAALTGAEALIPGVGLANRITGAGERYVLGQKKKASVAKGDKKISQAVLEALNPVRPYAEPSKGRRRRKTTANRFGGGPSSSSNRFGGGAGGGGNRFGG